MAPNRRRRTLQLVREVPTTTRKLLHGVIGQHDELDRTVVHVKALMVELLHANSREGKGKGKGRGRGRGRQDTVRPYALSSRALSRSRARALAAFSRHGRGLSRTTPRRGRSRRLPARVT